jgi:IS5 family transposase
MGQISIFDNENILDALSKQGDPLEKLNKSIKWNIFKPMLVKAFKKERRSNAGRPPFDYLIMFKILVLQDLYGLSDNQMQFHLLDRYSFKRFVGLNPENTIPDEKTIWLFREQLTQNGMFEKLFKKFNQFLDDSGFKAQKGMIVDANIVEVPRQRNSRDENKEIKGGNTPKDWKNKPGKLRQKDTDARWLKKNGVDHFGYKNHVCIDNKHKLIRNYNTTPANAHDSEVFHEILDGGNTNQTVWADSAYYSSESEEVLSEAGIKSKVHRKGYRNKKLSVFQKKQNRKKSGVRARVEHVFGRMAMMHNNVLRCIGQLRAANRIGMRNLVYNLTRYELFTRTV